MPLKISPRKDRNQALNIVGRIRLPDGRTIRVRRRADSNNLALAKEQAATLEAQILRDAYHGPRRGAVPFGKASEDFLRRKIPKLPDVKRIDRVLRAMQSFGDVNLNDVDQEMIDRLRDTLLGPAATPQTILRAVITPVRSILVHAHKRGWCDLPKFDIPKQPEGRTFYMLPHQVELLVAAAASPRFAALLLFLIDTGARVSEALAVVWRNVDLSGGRVIFWGDTTKSGKRRNAGLAPRTVAALASLPEREGPVFQWAFQRGGVEIVQPYADSEKMWGGQIKTAWRGAIRRAGLDRASPRMCFVTAGLHGIMRSTATFCC